MAATSSRAHLVRELSHSRRATTSSPQDFATATGSSFDAGRDAIHSTVQWPENTTQQQLPRQALQYDQFPDNISEGASEGSAEMSIELGRGVKRGVRDRSEDISQNAVFNMGNDSLYEVTGTPPLRARDSSRKTDDGLRRQASIRRAAGSAKSNEAPKRTTSWKHRSLSEALRNITTEDDTSLMVEDTVQRTATFNARNTRFARSRQTSAALPSAPSQQQTPRRATAPNNPTVQSNSFMLPDLPNITELVSGVRKDGTPLFTRTTKPQSRTRFTSGTHKQQHYPIESVPLPDEEKAIYASLQLLKERVDQLEMEKSEAAKRAEEYEGEIIDLRSQLAMGQGRPDSGLGSSASDEEGGPGWRQQKTRLQANVKALQDRLDRSERKVSVTEIAVKRITKERDELVTQIGVAYYNNEELKIENEGLKSSEEKLLKENDELRDEVDGLRKENQDLRVLIRQTQASYEDETRRQRSKVEKRAVRSASEVAPEVLDQGPVRQQERVRTKGQRTRTQQSEDVEETRRSGVLDEVTSDDLAIRIAEEVRKHRQEATTAAKGKGSINDQRTTRQSQTTNARDRSRSKSQSRQQQSATSADRSASGSKRTTTAATLAAADASDAESTTQLDFNLTRNKANYKRASLPTPVRAAAAGQVREEDSRDLTLLSWMDVNEVYKLRKKIEEEHRAKHLGAARAMSAPTERDGLTQQSAQGALGARKSSLKDMTGAAGSENGTGRFNLDDFARIAKSVRVQSPHTSDESIHPGQQQTQHETQTGDISISSNTSRRRRRAASAEGMTSAFILPDITLHSAANSQTVPNHDAGNCTACPPNGKDITIPTPIPVTDRLADVADVTNATIRPSQPPPRALAKVIKQLGDEISHMKIQLSVQQRLYHQHDPALSKRRRLDVKARMDHLTAEIERRSDQLYALYDVLEGQKQAAAAEGTGNPAHMDEQEVEETLESLGIDPVELTGRIGRRSVSVPFGLDGAGEMSEEELPWEGLSEVASEEEMERRRSREF